MSLPQSLRALRRVLPPRVPRARNPQRHVRFESSQPTKPTTNTTAAAADSSAASGTAPQGRLDRLLARTSRYLPARLRRPLQDFRTAPVSHVAAFLLLHELTAVLPIFGLFWAFQKFDVVPTEYVFGPWAPYVQEKALRMLGWARRKGYFGLREAGAREGEARFEEEFEREVEVEREREQEQGQRRGWLRSWTKRKGQEGEESDETLGKMGKAKKAAALIKEKVTIDNAENGYKIGVQLVAAYAITKALLIPRIAFSLLITPPTARALIWARQGLLAVFRR